MALADVYEVVLNMTILGERALAVFHALRAGGGFTASNVGQAQADSLISKYQAFTTNQLIFNHITVTNLDDPTDFAIHDLAGVTGVGVGEDMPCYDSFKVQFLRKRVDMRHGWKRLPGMEEGAQAGGNILAATKVNLDILCTAIVANWEETAAPGVNVANYIIVKRIKVVDPVTGDISYRLPIIDAELVFYQPTAFVTGVVTTQNTRKPSP